MWVDYIWQTQDFLICGDRMKIKITKKQLYNLYWNENLSGPILAKKFNCYPAIIYEEMKKYNISRKNLSDSHKSVKIPKKQLYNLYWVKMWTMMRIARYFGCSYPTIRSRMLEYGIPIRTISEANKGRKGIKGPKSPLYGRHPTQETKRKMIENRRPLEEQKGYNSERHKKHYCIEPDCSHEICYVNWLCGNKRCNSCADKRKWQNEKYREKVIKAVSKGLEIKPNKPEKILNELLNEVLPNEYKYVGNFKFWIERFNPDFINCNGQKKIIEMNGDYWHNLKDMKKKDKQKIKAYEKYGYKTLIVWEHELKNLGKVKNRILAFNNIGVK